MDHISKALERAQSERRSVRDWVIPSEARAIQPAVETELRNVTLSPAFLKERHVLCGRDENPMMTDLYRLLRTRVTQLMQQKGWSTIGLTSAGPKAGKTLTSINLAITMARDSARSVTLIDGDLRRPSIADTLGIAQDAGLIDYLATDIALCDVLTRPNIDNLVV